MGVEFQFTKVKNSGDGDGEGCSALWLYLEPLNHTVKRLGQYFIMWRLPQ